MTRLITAGCELGHVLAGGATAQIGAIANTSVVRSGAYSYEIPGGAGNQLSFGFTGVAGRTYFARVFVRKTGNPASAAALIACFRQSTNRQYEVRLGTSGGIGLFFNGTLIGSFSAALNDNQWYRIELQQSIGSGSADDLAQLRLDGTMVTLEANATRATVPPSEVMLGTVTGAIMDSGQSAYYDDFALNDDQGANQNTWPGDGNVVASFPTADSARAALWTGGAGGTTSLFEAVNNRPPIGTASETDLTQIEHAGGATGDYDATMQSYTTIGIGASDTITLVMPVVIVGEDISTGTKLLTHSVVSNPAIAAVANYDVGTVAVATYPTGWSDKAGTIAYSPSVTLGTSPVMRVTRPETAARVASVCAMALIVEYVPSAGPTGAFSASGLATTALAAKLAAVGAWTATGLAATVIAPALGAVGALTAAGVSTASFDATVTAGGGAVTGAFAAAGASSVSVAPVLAEIAAVTSAGTSTAAFVPVRAAVVAVGASGASTTALNGALAAKGTMAAVGASTATFAPVLAAAGTLVAASTSTATFTAAAAGQVTGAFSAAGASTVTVAPTLAAVGAVNAVGTSTVTTAAAETLAGMVAATGQSTSTFGARLAEVSATVVAGQSTAAFAPVIAQIGAFAAAGTSTASFTGVTTTASTGAFSAVATSTATFAASVTRTVAFNATGQSTVTTNAAVMRPAAFTAAANSGVVLLATISVTGAWVVAGQSAASFAPPPDVPPAVIVFYAGANDTQFSAARPTAAAAAAGAPPTSFSGGQQE